MSHLVKVKVQMKNEQALRAALEALKLQIAEGQQHQMYGRQMADGIAFSLPGWRHPVVVNLETGEAVYDNFGGSWGKQEQLDRVVQQYSIEVAREQALLSGFTFEEQRLENGDVELMMEKVACT